MPSAREQKHIGRSAIHWYSFLERLQSWNRNRTTQRTSPQPIVSDIASIQEEQSKAQENAENLEKLRDAVDKSQHILIECRAVFPFDFFPDSIIVDRQKLTLVHRPFFLMEQTVGVQHRDIKNVEADLGPFFGSITITSEHFVNNTQTINFLTRRNAVRIQRLIQGLIVAYREDIDISTIEEEKELVKLLDELGTTEVTKRP